MLLLLLLLLLVAASTGTSPPGAPGRDDAGAHDPPDPRRMLAASCASWHSSLFARVRLACSGGMSRLAAMTLVVHTLVVQPRPSDAPEGHRTRRC